MAEVDEPRGVVVPVGVALVPQLALEPDRRCDTPEQPLVEAQLRVDVRAGLQVVGELVEHRVRGHDEEQRQPVEDGARPGAGRRRRGVHAGTNVRGAPKWFRYPPQAMWVKICGITNEEDALLAVALGADALGFNFVPGSPRQVAPDTVAEILHRLPAGVVTVGVFRDEQPERVVELVNTLGLSGAQLHGREPLSDVRWVRRRVPFVIQGFAADDPALAAVGNGPVDIVLVDADEPGSGVVFDWALVDAVPAGRAAAARGRSAPEKRGAGDQARPAVGCRRLQRGRDHAGLGPQGRTEAAELHHRGA